MPEEKSIVDATKVAEHNAEVAQKLAGQDNLAKPPSSDDFAAATDALDKLAAQVKPKDEPLPENKEKKPDPGQQPPHEKKPEAPQKTPEELAAEDAVKKRAEEMFKDSPKLPPGASPKSSEAFSSIKERAAKLLEEREQEIEKLKAAVEAAKKPSPEIQAKEKELEDLRQWRAKMDVDADPKFREYDKTIDGHREFIYAQLRKNPLVTPETIEQIKRYGGPDAVKMDKLFEGLKDPTLQRIVESKVADIVQLQYQREQAVKAAKDNIAQYIKERQTASTREAEVSQKEVNTRLDSMLNALDWYKDRPVDPKADASAKAEAEEHNKFLAELRPQIAEAAKENTPEMRAIMITGLAQLFYLQKRVPGLEKQIADLTKERDEIKGKWEAVKQSSRSRLSESGAPASGSIPQAKKQDIFTTRAGDALDAIAKQVMEQKAAAASS